MGGGMGNLGGAAGALERMRLDDKRRAEELLAKRRAERAALKGQGKDDPELALLISEAAHEVRCGQYRIALKALSDESLARQRELARLESELGL